MTSPNHKPVLIVIAGPNGSGKTTITGKVLHHEWLEDALYINPDEVAEQQFGGWNNEKAILQAAQYCEEKREECLREHKSLIFETVLSTESKVDFIRRAKDAGYFIRLFFVCTSSPSINASRITRRVMKGGHDVPITKIISRFYRSIFNCQKSAAHADRTYIYDNSKEGEDAQLLFRLKEGKLFKSYTNTLPEWAQMILEQAENI